MIFIKKAKSRVSGQRTRGYSLVKCPDCKQSMEMRNDIAKKAQKCKKCKNKTHGDTKTRLFSCWSSMKNRVKNKPMTYKDIDLYIHSDWLKYENFKKWSIANGYSENKSIDRIDNNLGYEPSNCRWATHSEQQLNTREIQSNNTSGYKNISRQNGKWRVGFWENKKSICVALVNDLEEAIRIRNEYKRKQKS